MKKTTKKSAGICLCAIMALAQVSAQVNAQNDAQQTPQAAAQQSAQQAEQQAEPQSMQQIMQQTVPLTAQQTIELSLDQALAIALDENPTIKIANLEVERQKYVRREAYGGLYPTLDADGTYTKTIKNGQMMGFTMSQNNDFQFAGTLSLPLVAPAVWTNIKLSKDQMYVAVEAARGSKLTLTEEVKKAYYNVLLMEQSLSVLRESRENISSTVNETKAKYENGLASEYDLITAQVQLSNLDPQILQLEKGIEVSKQMLKMYLGLPLDVEIIQTQSLESFSDLADMSPDVFTTDVEDNSDYKSIELQQVILKRQLRLQQTTRMPILAAFGNYSISGTDMESPFAATTGKSKYDFTWSRPLTAGLSLQVPIFAGFTRTSKEKQIKNQMQQLELQRDYLKESLTVQANQSISDVLTYRGQMDANRKTVEQAQKGYDISRTRYNAGMGTMLEVSSAQLNLTQAKLQFTQAMYDYLASLAQYDRIVGREF